jgi:hypothetical protein
MTLAYIFEGSEHLFEDRQYLLDCSLHRSTVLRAGVNVALKLHCSILQQLKKPDVASNDLLVIVVQLIKKQIRLLRWRSRLRVAYVEPSELLIIRLKLTINSIVNCITKI